jgi:hypothetical protein
MPCKKCFCFLEDFLLVTIPNELSISNDIRIKSLRRILPEYVDWMQRLWFSLPKEEFDKAYTNACQIARRGRKQVEYEYIVFTATSNFLSFQFPWFSKELDFMKILLVEAGFVKKKRQNTYLTTAREYLTYMVPRCIFMLKDIHGDHMNPKGLLTDITSTLLKQSKKSEEVMLDDLYD